ncbi:Por secretion system C-terminal sorting domain-containing protein [Halpernia humi]|uniref:Por secretion system C-terminal sorting domain-containing protein n=1 Tax=Halpernia humi TaxID=493375 RepID=A0A1H6APL7_9FLAO|nr:T9SS type A sorting domain-containing protein [Halpernia humi]SEG50471.1 Por secretion system C-terminal sorting domain-containing protein [Halpernia humi]
MEKRIFYKSFRFLGFGRNIFMLRLLMVLVFLFFAGLIKTKAQSVTVNPTSVCSGQSFTATASYTPFLSTISNYEWSLNGGAVLATTTTNFYTFSSAPVGTNTINVKINYLFLGFIPGNANANTTITVNPNLPASVSISASPSASICAGTSVTFTATPTNGGSSPTYQWKVNGANAGTNSPTFSISTLTNNDKVTVVMTSNASPCSVNSPATSNQLTMTVNPNLPASVSISASPSTSICAGTSVTFTATPTNGGTAPTYQWKVNNVNAGTNSPTFTTATLANNDKVKVVMTSNASPCSVNSPATSNQLTITSLDKTWNGSTTNWATASNWSPSGVPTASNCVDIPNVSLKPIILSGTNALAKNLTINSGGKLTINGGGNLTVTDFIKNNTGSDDSFTLKSDGNLIQTNNVSNTGNMTVERTVTGLQNNPGTAVDYVYWSSPVAGQLTKGTSGFSPGTPSNRFFSYRESNDRFYETADNTFVPGKGYAVQAVNGFSDYKFKGVPNNGNISIPITKSADNPVGVVHGYNLVGNPYPSNISFDDLYAGNPGLLVNTVYFWTNNNYTANQQGSSYAGNNYAVFNGTGGNPIGVNGTIKVGQAFIVQAQASGTLNFKNSYRVSTSGTFYQKNSSTKNRFWLSLTNPNNVVNSQLIGYVAGATDGFEQDYDNEAFDNYSDLFYSELAGKKLVIQGKSENFTPDDTVDLGANISQNGTYTIALGKAEGIFANSQTIYLKDKETGMVTNLSQNNYTFQATKGLSENRFEIIYKPEEVLSTGEVTKGNLLVYRDANNFVIKASQKISTVEVYDASGRLLYKIAPANTEVTLSADRLSKGILILKIDLQNGEILTRKIRN